jgi:rare lipoprotein A
MTRSFILVGAAAILYLIPVAQHLGVISEPSAGGPGATLGRIAWYGHKFNGRRTASGERFDAGAMTMAHKTLPFGTRVRITNLKNNKNVVLRVNDRGPSSPELMGDVTYAAAQKLGMSHWGIVDAKLNVVGKASRRLSKKS